ncbi:MAG: tRNA pseudouridine(55) synthase, partial [Calditrichota bacterium]
MNQSKTNTYSADEGRVLVVDKPVDWTSFDVVNKIRRMSGIKKVGHAGTLDPFATGILLICLGKATKRFSELLELEKEYEAEITLGSETDTMDHTGTVILEKEIPAFSHEDVEATFEGLRGDIEQEIPSYS